MVDLSSGQLAGPAWSDPAVRAAVGRVGRLALLCLVGGLVLLTGFVALAVLVSAASDDLRQNGGQTTGIVVVLRPDRRYQDGNADIRYTVDGHEYTGRQGLGADAANYYSGETVTVYYDFGHPGRFTINDEDNQPGWTVWLMVIALVAGVLSLSFAGIVGLRRRRLKRVLSACSWQPAWFEPVPKKPRRDQLIRVRLTGSDGGPTGDDLLYRGRAAFAGKLFGPRPDIASSIDDPWHGRFHLPGRIAGPVGHWAVLTNENDIAVLMPVCR